LAKNKIPSSTPGFDPSFGAGSFFSQKKLIFNEIGKKKGNAEQNVQVRKRADKIHLLRFRHRTIGAPTDFRIECFFYKKN
jgi:hypothetical protein